ncbi:cell division protein FtsL [Clostridium sp. AF34-10BH]|uniref:FtsB family cell division protein n=1 Tax=Clostridium sp. AF34-10BH TaxID=2293011 RepID=UPI000E52182A|nr:cell division protein FtsL [Clostridium sp. AF34-10BH]RHP32995.1 cell division protein FtsL [Clostridium sp. AF34-10BH]
MTQKKRHSPYMQDNMAHSLQEELNSQPHIPSAATRHNQDKAKHMNIGYVVFLTFALLLCAVILINYIHLQASVISHINEITRLETELNTLKRSNDEEKNRLESNIDLEYIRQIAIGELGMVYANEDQIILYKTQMHDSMRKNTD